MCLFVSCILVHANGPNRRIIIIFSLILDAYITHVGRYEWELPADGLPINGNTGTTRDGGKNEKYIDKKKYITTCVTADGPNNKHGLYAARAVCLL